MANQFLQFFAEGQLEKAYQLTAWSIHRELDFNGFRAQATEFRGKLGPGGYQRELITGQLAQNGRGITLKFRAAFKVGAIYEEVLLILESGQWKVAGYWFSPASS